MTRITKMKRQRVEEASEFQSIDLKSGGTAQVAAVQENTEEIEQGDSEPAGKKKRIRHRSILPQEAQEAEPGKHDSLLTKAERDALKRRSRREKAKEKKMNCFLCRQKGHSVANCPRNTQRTIDDIQLSELGNICFRCGSLEHTLAKCDKKPDPKNPLPYSTCFICKQSGHLVGQCPENDRGIYPNGGCCKFCGSVRHLAKDCKPMEQEKGAIMLGTMDMNQGGDDDDVFDSIHKIQKEKPEPKPVVKKQKKENRAFDTVFGYLTHTQDIDNLVGKEFCNNLKANDPNSPKFCTARNQVDVSPFSPDHYYYNVTEQLYGTNDPKIPLAPVAPMSGFVQQAAKDSFRYANPGQLQQVMAGYDPQKIPVHTALAAEFTIFDKWFSSVPGSTYPNRISSHCASSGGMYDNDEYKVLGTPCRSIFQDLDDAGVSWKNYFGEEPSLLLLRNTRLKMVERSRLMSDFYKDAAAGKLAKYTYLEPNYGNFAFNAVKYNDGHAEYLLKRVYEAVRNSPQWKTSLLLITYDEHGGFFDHVPPPKAPNPDGKYIDDPNIPGVVYSFDRLGVRVPIIAVSPWMPKGKVEHEPKGPYPDSQYCHASIPATIRSIFKLKSPPLSTREVWTGNFESILLDKPRDDCPFVMPAVNMNGF
ncbi:hypothetical protein HDV01_004512 [Terramyces sp. JEL0728]|nr:hypothetical protein HDV01_004512 [Terramyces sp. JEL0728]